LVGVVGRFGTCPNADEKRSKAIRMNEIFCTRLSRMRPLGINGLASPIVISPTMEAKLELESDSNLSFSSWEHLLQCTEREIGICGGRLNCRRILTIEQIEELEQHLQFRPLTDIEPLGKAHVEIHIRGCSKSIPARPVIYAVEGSVSVRVFKIYRLAAVMKSTLSSEDTAKLYLPWKHQQSIDLEGVIQWQVWRTFIKIGTIYERSRRRNEPAVGAREWAVRVGSTSPRFGDYRCYADKAIRRQSIDAELIVGLSGVSIVSVQCKTAAQALVETNNQSVVLAFVPGAESVYRPCGERWQKSAGRSARGECDVRLPSSQQIVHVAMIIVRLNDQVFANLALDADAEAVGERRAKTTVYAGRQKLGRYGRVS